MAQDAHNQSGMSGEVRFRVPLVVVLPIAALLVIGGLAFGFSRILLSLEPEAATALALVMAANVLGACAFYALRPDTARRRWPELAAVVLYPVLIGIAVAQTGFLDAEEAAPADEGGEVAAPAGDNTIVAANTAFETDEITAAAGEKVSGTLENEDSVDHNIAFYETEEDISSPETALFTSDTAGSGASVPFEFDAPKEPGDYPFVCDFHPTTMTGTLVVEAGGGGGGSGGEGSEGGGG
jgi:plastocyanin